MDEKANVVDMDQVLQQKLKEKQITQVNAANETDEQFDRRYANVGNTINQNLKSMEDFVDRNVFSGAPEQEAQKTDLDLNHDYVFTNVKRTVFKANKNAYKNIKKYGKAKPTKDDKKRKLDIKGFFKSFTNAFVEEFKGKEANYQQALLETARTQNVHADKTTAYELSKLIKYSDSIYKMLDKNNTSSMYSQAEKKALKNLPEKMKKRVSTELFHEYRFGVAPFLKTYKKKWFFGSKYYNLDGKRIKVKNGELDPEEYNKTTAEALLLETNAEVEGNADTLKRNREKKAVVLSRITKEMLEYGEKFNPEKMTDLYVANHIIELQEYYARLNAFHHLMSANRWFFFGNEKKDGAKGINEQILEAEDPSFLKLIKTHILDMRFPVANFIESHMRAHCLQSNKDFNKGRRKNYFRKSEVIPMVTIDNDYSEVDDLRIKEAVDLDVLNSEIIDQQEIYDRFTAFGCDYSVVDLSKMNALDAEEYEKNLTGEKSRLNSGITINNLTNKLRKIRYTQAVTMSGDVSERLKAELDKIGEAAKTDVQNYNKTVEEDMKVPEVPYLSMSRAEGLNETVLIDLQSMRQKIHSGKGSVMYLQYGPEIDHIYAKLYTAVKLQGQFTARKKAIAEKLHVDEIRGLEEDLKKSGKPERLRKSWRERIDAIRKQNIEAMKVASKNPFAGFAQEFLAEERTKRAEQEYDEIDKKLEYTATQIDLCKKTLDFFLTDPTEQRMLVNDDYENIEQFLNAEKLGYMFDVSKMEDFDRILFDAVKDTERELEKEAGDDAVRIGVKEQKKTYRMKAGRVHQVRRRGRQASDFATVNREAMRFRTDTKDLFVKLILMKPEELSKFNYKDTIPVSSEKERKQAVGNLELLYRIMGKVGEFDPQFYGNDRKLRKFFNDCKANGILQEDAKYARFKLDIRTKIDMLSAWNKYVNEIKENQLDKDYAYLDTDSLEGLSVDRMERLKRNLSNTAKLLEDEVKTIEQDLSKNKSINEEEIDGFVIKPEGEANKKQHATKSIAYRLRKNKADNCKLLIKMLDRKIKQEKAKEGLSELTSEAYYSKYNRAIKDTEIEVAKTWDFPGADDTFLALRKMTKSEGIAALKKNDLASRVYEEKKKDPEYLNKDENVKKEATELLLRVNQIKVGPELLELSERLFDIDSKAVPEEHEITQLLGYAYTILDLENIINANDRFSDPAYTALRKHFEKPENKREFTAIKNMYKIMEPLYKALDCYLQSHGIGGCGSFEVMTEYYQKRTEIDEDENKTNEQKDEELDALKARIESESNEKLFDANHAYGELKKNISSFDPKEFDFVLHQDWNAKLFRHVYRAGVKLDLSKQDEWKKLFTTISQKGYIKTKPKKGEIEDPEKEILWMKVAASQILARWPQSLEDFYVERSRQVTADALGKSITRLFGDYGKFYVDKTTAVKISETITYKQQMIYQGVTEDKRRQLDEALVHSGYDSTVFKYLFEDVEINGAGQPVSLEASERRTRNIDLADAFIERNLEKTERLTSPKKRWQETVMRLFKNALSFKITSKVTNKDYIKKHFAYLYGEARKFAALKQIYEHEKHLLDDAEVIKENRMTAHQVTEIKNAFGPKTRSLYASYFEMLEAYAHSLFVDKEGRFDVGLPAEAFVELKEKKEEKKRKENNKVKIETVLQERQDSFERALRHVNAELDREFLSQKVTKAEEVNNTLKVIEIKGDANVLKLVQKEGFEGRLSDINILFNTPEFAKLIAEYNENIRKTSKAYDEHQPLVNQFDKLQKEGKRGTQEYEDLYKQIYEKRDALTKFEGKTAVKYFNITEQQKLNKKFYNAYNECHKKDGSLNLYEVKKNADGKKETIDRIEMYADFHANLAKECSRIYRELKSFFGDKKNLSKDTFTAEGIIDAFKNDEMTAKLCEYRKIDLYLGLLEVDRKDFKTKDYNFMKSMGTYIDKVTEDKDAKVKELEQLRKAKKKGMLVDGVNEQLMISLEEQVKKLEARISDMKLAKELIQEIVKDMDSTSATNPVRMIHDYVQMIFLSLKSYGVEGNGEIIEDQVKREADDMLSEEKIREIAYDEADKIGDAHLELQHEVNQRLGFETKTKTGTSSKGGK